MSESLCLGLMSGTSMDGIDAALIMTDGQDQIKSIASSFYPYPACFRQYLKLAETATKQAEGDLAQAEVFFQKQAQTPDSAILELLAHYQLNELTLNNIILLSTFLHKKVASELIEQSALTTSDIALVGYHGQTLYHAPTKRFTLQAGDCQYLANLLNIPVAGLFRLDDVAQGGQGAPLAPIYHWALVKNDGLIPAAILNCGGIANVTLITDDDPNKLLAFDTGPGNVLLDRLVREKTQQKLFFDQDGRLALAGNFNEDAFNALMQNCLPANFLTAKPPKSLDSYDCHLPECINHLSLEDACATLAAFSAECMARSLDWCDQAPTRWILAGGGWHNPAILSEFKSRLEKRLKQTPQIITAKQLGWQQDALEAEAFAYLAKRVQLGLPLSFPGTTGVAQALTGGKIFSPQSS